MYGDGMRQSLVQSKRTGPRGSIRRHFHFRSRHDSLQKSAMRLVVMLACLSVSAAWAPATAGIWNQRSSTHLFSAAPAHRWPSARAVNMCVPQSAWVPLGGGKAGDAVCKRTLEAGSGEVAQKGAEVEVEYVGTLAEKDWTVDDVLECWLDVRCVSIFTSLACTLALSLTLAHAHSFSVSLSLSLPCSLFLTLSSLYASLSHFFSLFLSLSLSLSL